MHSHLLLQYQWWLGQQVASVVHWELMEGEDEKEDGREGKGEERRGGKGRRQSEKGGK